MALGDLIRSGDFKGEKHVPVIELPENVEAGKPFSVTVSVGKEVPHPNTPEHHIAWIEVYYKPDGPRPVYMVARFAPAPTHGDSRLKFRMKVDEPGYIVALEHCNIHGLWDNSKRVEVE